MTAPTPQRIARATGVAYLGIIVTGIFAEFVVRMSLVKQGDAAATASNIAGSADLFRIGLTADIVMIALDVGVAVGLYTLLRDVHRPLAVLATALRLIQAAVLGANLMNMVEALQWATRSTGADGIAARSAQEMVLASMEVHRMTYDLGLVFFGLACLALGHLLRVSRLLPRLLGIGLSVAGVVYLIGSFAVVLAPAVAPNLDLMYGLALAAELAVASRLTTKGVAATATTQAPFVAPV